jgi:glucose/arabinose dehydrogenase
MTTSMPHRPATRNATRPFLRTLVATTLLAAPLQVACADTAPRQPAAQSLESAPFDVAPVAKLEEPWALAFLPDGRLLVTEKKGRLRLVAQDGKVGTIGGVPAVDYGGQGGLGDVAIHPQFATNGLVYLSYAEAGDADTRGAAVARAKLTLDAAGGGALSDVQVIWRQVPKVTGRGHYGHRIAFGPDGKLWISSGERQKFDPSQDMNSNLGKVVRLNDDGTPAKDNPFADKGGVAAQIWSLGHRNPLGLAFDAQGRPWEVEMGPKGGDELNLVVKGRNYGYPTVSNGDHYDGRTIPDHDTRPEFETPKTWWTPVISPSRLVIYSGAKFPQWQGDAFISGLSSMSLVRVHIDGSNAREAERWDFQRRMRAVAQGPDGDLWMLEDGVGGRLLRLSPKAQAKK